MLSELLPRTELINVKICMALQVTALQNARGLVEAEPYAVVGGQVAIRVWEDDTSSGGTVPVVMMPLPTTLEEAEVLSFLDGSQNIPIFDEAAFAPWNVCWTVSLSILLLPASTKSFSI